MHKKRIKELDRTMRDYSGHSLKSLLKRNTGRGQLTRLRRVAIYILYQELYCCSMVELSKILGISYLLVYDGITVSASKIVSKEGVLYRDYLHLTSFE